MINTLAIRFSMSSRAKSLVSIFAFSMKCFTAHDAALWQPNRPVLMRSASTSIFLEQGFGELLRYGVLPPKEIVRPESARIAMQGVQPKGVDENGMAINPVGKTIKSIFPYYLTHKGIGGAKRDEPLEVKQLTIEDLERAVVDARENADRIYRDIFEEFSYVTDHLRSVQPEWRAEARESMYRQQQMVVENLTEKVNQAPEKTSDEFLYQDKAEATRELDVAKRILTDIPSALRKKDIEYRTWNTLPYQRYRGADKE